MTDSATTHPGTDPHPSADPMIAKATAAMLNAILENNRPYDLKYLRRLALQLRVPVFEAPLNDGRRALCWILGWGEQAGKVYLLLPRITEHRFRRRWNGPAEVLLVGKASAGQAARLLTGLTRLLSNRPPSEQ